MKREWKPGDVAIRKSAVSPHEMVSVATTCFTHRDLGLHWHHVGGGFDLLGEEGGPTYRPLVVIDPEDREQVERLHTLWCEAIVSKGTSSRQIDSMQAALREFANPKPPKPDEPQGLGAVVEDEQGNRWIRHGSGPRPWMLAGASPSNRDTYAYSTLPAVRILSEGVTQ